MSLTLILCGSRCLVIEPCSACVCFVFVVSSVRLTSHLSPLPLKCQNIPDGFIVPCYPQNIHFPAPNAPNSERTHLPATSGIVVIYLLVPPTPCSTPLPYYTPPPSHLAPSAYQPPYLLMQKTLFVIQMSPGEERDLCYRVKRRSTSRSGTSQNPQTPTPNQHQSQKHKSHVLIV